MDYIQVVIFSLNKQEYALKINSVKEIIKLTEITAVPNSQEYISGIINLRGHVVPIINLARMFSLAETPHTEDSRIIIMNIEDKNVGIIVDSVTEVMVINQENIQTDAGLSDKNNDYIAGIGNLGDRLLLILEAEKLITSNIN